MVPSLYGLWMQRRKAKELVLLQEVPSVSWLRGFMSTRKGNTYEVELAQYLTEKLTIPVARSPLSGGGLNDVQMADLIGTPEVWVEAKRTERVSVYSAIEQAERGITARQSPDVPVVITRKNRMATEKSLVTMRLDDWVDLYRAYLMHTGVING